MSSKTILFFAYNIWFFKMFTYNRWLEPDDTLNYADYSYIGSNESCQYKPFFDKITQEGCLATQLNFGVRGFKFSIYDWNLGLPFVRKGPGNIVICDSEPGSSGCDNPANIYGGYSGFKNECAESKCCRDYQTFQFELGIIIEWLKTHPQAIVTLFLNDNVEPKPLVEEIVITANELKYDPILRPTDWTVGHHDQTWPTLGWMRANNKRLVIFTRGSFDTSVTWQEFTRCWENQVSANPRFVYREQPESKGKGDQRKIVVLNNYAALPTGEVIPTIMLGPAKYLGSKAFIQYCQGKGYADGRKPNGYFLNNIIELISIDETTYKKTAFDYIGELRL